MDQIAQHRPGDIAVDAKTLKRHIIALLAYPQPVQQHLQLQNIKKLNMYVNFSHV
jgi:hypothetical protein